jgi:hypothetical protein
MGIEYRNLRRGATWLSGLARGVEHWYASFDQDTVACFSDNDCALDYCHTLYSRIGVSESLLFEVKFTDWLAHLTLRAYFVVSLIREYNFNLHTSILSYRQRNKSKRDC